MEITPGLVVGMAWWYVVLAFFNYFENTLLASDAAVAFSFRLQFYPVEGVSGSVLHAYCLLRVSPGQSV